MGPFAQSTLDEFTQEAILIVAAVLLIAVSVGWIVMSRLITKEIRKQALRRMRATAPRRKPAKDKDIWSYPP